MEKREKKISKFLWAVLTLILAAPVFLYWFLDYVKLGYSEQVGFPLVFYEFQGGAVGPVTDEFLLPNLLIDGALVIVVAGILSWVLLRFRR